MFKSLTTKIFALLLLTALVGACKNNRVTRVDPEKTIDLSGRWNDTDSKLTATEMIQDILTADWLANHLKAKNNEKPVVIVGLIKNNSHEHINPETFCKDIERSFITSQRVRLVEGGQMRDEIRAERADQQNFSSESTMKKWGLEVGADYMLQGVLNSTVDEFKKEKVVEYQIDLQLTNMQTNEVVWIGDKKIKKYIKD